MKALLSVLKALAVMFLAAWGTGTTCGAFVTTGTISDVQAYVGFGTFFLLGAAFLYRAWFWSR